MGIKARIRGAIQSAVKHSDWYVNGVFSDCGKFWDQKVFNLDVVNLGSTSAVCAFDYSGLPIKGANWAMSRNYLAGDKAILENFSSLLKAKGAVVIIPLCPFSSLSGRYDGFDDRYYTFLYPSSIPGFSKARQNAVKDMQANPVPYYPAFQLWLALRKRVGAIFGLGTRRPPSADSMERNADFWISSWMREFSLDSLDDPLSLVNRDAMDQAVCRLNGIVAYCRELGHRPVFTVPPVYAALAARFSKNARARFVYDMVERLADKDVVMLDYMDDAEFSADISLFDNSYLLSAAGAKKFTRRILKDIGLIS